MFDQYIENRIAQVKKTIRSLEKYGNIEGEFKLYLLHEAQKFLYELEILKDEK